MQSTTRVEKADDELSSHGPENDCNKPAARQHRASSTRSVIANWAGQAVTVISGFVMPRLINDSMGAAELGVWDFGWSMGAIIAMSQLGMGSSAGYHVSCYRAKGDWDELNRVLSATLALVTYTALLALGVSAIICFFTPAIMRNDPHLVSEARWMVAATGVAAAMRMATMVYGGVLVGSHNFDKLNTVEIVADVLMVIALFVAIYFEAGLKVMAVCIAGRQVLDMLAKRTFAHRLFPELCLRPRWRDWKRFHEIAGYGGKTLLDAAGNIILNQFMVALLLRYHDAAAVAMFCRPMALVRNTTRFIMGYARVLVPQAGEFHARGQRSKLSELLVRSTRNVLLLSLPIVVVLLILGGPLLHLWMGPAYANPILLRILVIGFLPFFAQRATWHILLGVGGHGWASMYSLSGAIFAVLLGLLFLGVFKWGLIGAALAVALPIGVINLWSLPRAGCRIAGLSMYRYYVDSFIPPIKLVLPFAIVVLAAHFVFINPLISVIAAVVAGGPVLILSYWKTALPEGIKRRVRALFDRLGLRIHTC